MLQRTNTIVFCTYSLFASATIARHAHRRPHHKHSPRSEVTSSAIPLNKEPQRILTSTLAAPSPSFTAGDAVLDDIIKIQSGLNDLPGDLLAIISLLEHRLSEIERVLAGYLDDSPAQPPTSTNFPAGPIGPALSPALEGTFPLQTDPLSEQVPTTTTVTVSSDPPATTSPATTTTATTTADQEEEEPTSYPKTRSTRITRTLTRVTTIPAPRPTGIGSNNNNSSNATLPSVNGTSSFVPPAPWPKPYLVSSAFSSSVVVVASSSLSSSSSSSTGGVDADEASDVMEMVPTQTS